MRTSVVVPVHNGKEFYRPFLRAYDVARGKVNYFLELILVSNHNSTKDYLNMLLSDYDFEYTHVDCPKKGSYAARNYGFGYSRGARIVFTDIDCVLDKDFFTHLDTINVDEDVIIAGNIKYFQNDEFDKKNVYNFIESKLFLNLDKAKQENIGFTANTCVHRDLFSRSLFDEVSSGGDVQFYRMLQSKGVKYQFADALIVNHPYRTKEELEVKIRRVANGLVETRRNRGLITSLVFIFINPWLKFVRLDSSTNVLIQLFILYRMNLVFRINTVRYILSK